MGGFSDAELTGLLDDLESDRTERKEAWAGSAPEKASEAICAFANDMSGRGLPGVLFIGAKDDGASARMGVTDQLLLNLADLRSNGNILPPPMISVEKRFLKGADIAVLIVWPSDAPPVKYRGRIWIRVGPRRALATVQEERVLNERRRHHDLPFDLHALPAATLADLNKSEFEGEYLPRAFAQDVVAANERSFEERLASCRMIVAADEPTPTVLGVLTIGVTPRSWLACAYIQFLRISGTQWGDPVTDEEVVDGSLATTLRRLDDKLKAHMTVGVDITSSETEIRSSAYPMSALQQLTRNAVMHRTYESTNAPIRVYWFDDRIEIHSPGGPFGVVTTENFGHPGITDYRNPHIAEALKNLGYVQRFGVGIATAQRALRENGNRPAEFVVSPSAVLATVYRRA